MRPPISAQIAAAFGRLAGWARRWPAAAWAAGLLLCPYGWYLGIYWAVALGALGPLPDRKELLRLRQPEASVVYAIDGAVLGRYFIENRVSIPLDQIPQHLTSALLATEDVRFYRHDGVDTRSLLRVAFRSLLLRDAAAGGGSTLTQQLAKNLFPRESFRFGSLAANKLREMVLARRLESACSKDEILAWYLNTVPFGDQAFGIEMAAQRFFSKPAAALLEEEAALLVGMLKAPTAYNPRKSPDAAQARRNVVLRQRARYGQIPQQRADSLAALPLRLRYTPGSHSEGLAPYFRESLRLELDRWCQTRAKPGGGTWNLYRDGLRIYTTLHSSLQQYAEQAAAEHLAVLQAAFDRQWTVQKRNKMAAPLLDALIRESPRYRALAAAGRSEAEAMEAMRQPVRMQIYTSRGLADTLLSPADSIVHHLFVLQAGLLAVDPGSGHVRAWVGGINHRIFQFDHVNSRRQAGSVFKPVVYATALEAGLSPCDYVPNDRLVMEEYGNWSPDNADQEYGGEYSLKGALTHSVNIVAVSLMQQVGAERVVETARRLGIAGELQPYPSLALGAGEVSLREMATVYSAFVNGGRKTEPVYLLRIEDAQGHVLYETPAEIPPQVLSPETSALMLTMLRNVVDKGTAQRIRTRYGLKTDIAGKTGTTQRQTDGWFLGVTPDLVAGIWVGADDPRIHFRSMAQGQGANTALPIFARFLQQTYADPAFAQMQQAHFQELPDTLREQLDCDEFWFPLSMDAFHEWWQQQESQETGEIPVP
ncbi:MAG: transglycosylase domain-containing protein [Bacteroidia bacterium]|nr:transglycosylase domain-containing protein [Bacteroidia bacterium]